MTSALNEAADLRSGTGDAIAFEVETKPQKFGDGKTFHEYRVLMRFRGRLAGAKDGPRRAHRTARDARLAGERWVREISAHRLYAVRVTREDIRTGEARSCQSCAIAQALRRNQERMGFSQQCFDFKVSPYGFMDDVDGIALAKRYGCGDVLFTGEDGMPDVIQEYRGEFYIRSMEEWAREWDDWADSRTMSLAEWRESQGYDDGETPCKPSPCAFVLDVTTMKVVGEE